MLETFRGRLLSSFSTALRCAGEWADDADAPGEVIAHAPFMR